MQPAKIITLLTDFGMRDGYVAAMHGVIRGICSAVTIIDLSHDIEPQNIHAGAFLLSAHYRFFPSHTIHVAVIDPGVGGTRKIILAKTPQYTFLAPNNGLLSFLDDQQNPQFYEIDNAKYWLPEISRTFHGRDIFAPVAGHLAAGVAPKKLGTPIREIVRLPSLLPLRTADTVTGKIVYVDRFGNLISNVRAGDLPQEVSRCHVRFGEQEIGAIASHYAATKPGMLVALIDSFGCVEIAVNGGSAAKIFPEYAKLALEIVWNRQRV